MKLQQRNLLLDYMNQYSNNNSKCNRNFTPLNSTYFSNKTYSSNSKSVNKNSKSKIFLNKIKQKQPLQLDFNYLPNKYCLSYRNIKENNINLNNKKINFLGLQKPILNENNISNSISKIKNRNVANNNEKLPCLSERSLKNNDFETNGKNFYNKKYIRQYEYDTYKLLHKKKSKQKIIMHDVFYRKTYNKNFYEIILNKNEYCKCLQKHLNDDILLSNTPLRINKKKSKTNSFKKNLNWINDELIMNIKRNIIYLNSKNETIFQNYNTVNLTEKDLLEINEIFKNYDFKNFSLAFQQTSNQKNNLLYLFPIINKIIKSNSFSQKQKNNNILSKKIVSTCDISENKNSYYKNDSVMKNKLWKKKTTENDKKNFAGKNKADKDKKYIDFNQNFPKLKKSQSDNCIIATNILDELCSNNSIDNDIKSNASYNNLLENKKISIKIHDSHNNFKNDLNLIFNNKLPSTNNLLKEFYSKRYKEKNKPIKEFGKNDNLFFKNINTKKSEIILEQNIDEIDKNVETKLSKFKDKKNNQINKYCNKIKIMKKKIKNNTNTIKCEDEDDETNSINNSKCKNDSRKICNNNIGKKYTSDNTTIKIHKKIKINNMRKSPKKKPEIQKYKNSNQKRKLIANKTVDKNESFKSFKSCCNNNLNSQLEKVNRENNKNIDIYEFFINNSINNEENKETDSFLKNNYEKQKCIKDDFYYYYYNIFNFDQKYQKDSKLGFINNINNQRTKQKGDNIYSIKDNNIHQFRDNNIYHYKSNVKNDSSPDHVHKTSGKSLNNSPFKEKKIQSQKDLQKKQNTNSSQGGAFLNFFKNENNNEDSYSNKFFLNNDDHSQKGNLKRRNLFIKRKGKYGNTSKNSNYGKSSEAKSKIHSKRKKGEFYKKFLLQFSSVIRKMENLPIENYIMKMNEYFHKLEDKSSPCRNSTAENNINSFLENLRNGIEKNNKKKIIGKYNCHSINYISTIGNSLGNKI